MAKPLGEAIPTRQKISSLRYMCSRSGKADESGGFSEMEGRAVDGFDLDVFFGVFFVTSKFIFEEIQEL